MELTNEEIARVLAMYWGQQCVFESGAKRDLTYGDIVVYAIGMAQAGKCKLLLTSLSSITDEHAIALVGLLGLNYQLQENNIFWSKDFITTSFFKRISNFSPFTAYSVVQQLIMWGYAVPLFFGLNHLANGKTAIELGIAISNKRIKEAVS